MNRQAVFTDVSNKVAERYRLFLEKLLNAYNRTILTADFNARSLATFNAEVANMHNQYLEFEVEAIVETYNSVQDMVREDTKSQSVNVLEDDAWAENLVANTNFLYDAIKLQSQKDVLYINNFIRTKAIQLMNQSDYDVAYNLIFNHKELSFYYTDKLGRKLNSQKYIRTITRDFMVKNYNDLVIGSAILNAIEEVTIENTDPNHREHGKVIAVNGTDSVNYFDIRDDVFHPNSQSIVRL